MTQVQLPVIEKTIVTGFLWWRKKMKVVAQQVALGPEYGGLSATAKVEIFRDGKSVYKAEIPYAMPISEIMLPMQVYLLAMNPKPPPAEWQSIMEKFVHSCEGFKPPDKMWWTKEPIF